jgi:acetolactate synthase I/II/III large subunit
MELKVSDCIASFLKEKGIKHVFGIIGAGNAHIFDSINSLGFTEIISVHHEQAAVMSAAAYFRTSGQVTAAVVTTGAGSTNAVTGVVSAWMDSLPVLIISGNEKSIHARQDNDLRIWGVQGYDSTAMVEKVTKFSSRVMKPKNIYYELEKSYHISRTGRPGPCWIDVPMDIQAATIKLNQLEQFENPTPVSFIPLKTAQTVLDCAQKTVKMIQETKRPLFWLGHGVRLAGGVDKIEELLTLSKIPALLTWQGMDMLHSEHPFIFGRAGIYGQRSANFILQNCDLLICIGTRMAYPQVGYNIDELARAAKIVVVDIDEKEVTKFSNRVDLPVCSDAKHFIETLLKELDKSEIPSFEPWLDVCNNLQKRYPTIAKEHQDSNGYINSYKFIDKISNDLEEGYHITTDMGTALLSGHQVFNMKKHQRVITSTGLGEMGFGLPAAVGVSFAINKGKVLCLNCDGGMMMNLQELQVVDHHKLPIKIVIFNNDGYLMIKHTQKSLFNNRYVCTDRATGVSCPDFAKIATAFNLTYYSVKNWKDYENQIGDFLTSDRAAICEVFTDPEQTFYPKVATSIKSDGTMVSKPLEDMSPLLDRKDFLESMIIEPIKL